MDGLAADGVLFEQVVSTHPLTFPAHASLMTGMWPMGHGVRDFSGYVLGEDQVTLAETLSRVGYRCAAFVSAAVLDHRTGMAQGFSDYHDGFDSFLTKGGELAERPGPETLALAWQWLADRSGQGPLFVWVHLFEPHHPYLPPEPFRSLHSGHPYAKEVAYTDQLLGGFLQNLKTAGFYDSSVIAVVSDHGEGLGEHGESRHGFFLYESTVRVPWIMRLPNSALKGTRVSGSVSLVDVFPTLLHALDVDRRYWPGTIQGRSRIRSIRHGEPDRDPLYMESWTPRNQYGWNELRGIVLGGLKFVEAPVPELFNLRDDPGELHNLYQRNRAMASELRERLRQMEARYDRKTEARAEVDPELEERLRSLGYAGVSGAVAVSRGQPRADPKEKIAIYEQAQRGADAAREGRFKAAIGDLSGAARAAPESVSIAASLAMAHRETGQHSEALNWFFRVLERTPSDTAMRLEVAKYLLALKREEEALGQLRAILKERPGHFLAHFNLGTVMAMRSEYETAIGHFEAALKQREDVGVLHSLALAEAHAGLLERARVHWLRALEIDPQARQAHAGLARVYKLLGDERRAAEHQGKAEAARPRP